MSGIQLMSLISRSPVKMLARMKQIPEYYAEFLPMSGGALSFSLLLLVAVEQAFLVPLGGHHFVFM